MLMEKLECSAEFDAAIDSTRPDQVTWAKRKLVKSRGKRYCALRRAKPIASTCEREKMSSFGALLRSCSDMTSDID